MLYYAFLLFLLLEPLDLGCEDSGNGRPFERAGNPSERVPSDFVVFEHVDEEAERRVQPGGEADPVCYIAGQLGPVRQILKKVIYYCT